MQKLVILVGTIFFAVVVTCIYAIAQGWIIYSISPEYYTQSKFLQFDYGGIMPGSEREEVAALQVVSFWWIGLVIGLFIGMTAMIYNQFQNIKTAIAAAFLVIFCTVVICNIIVFIWAKFYGPKVSVAGEIPLYVSNKSNFIAVGAVDDFSYITAILGMILAVIYMVGYKNRLARASTGAKNPLRDNSTVP